MRKKSEQREFGFTNWGGKRRGAGRKPKGERAGASHAVRTRFAARHPVHVTMRIAAWSPSLRADDSHAIVVSAMAEVSRRPDFRVCYYGLQSNHVHLIVEAKHADALARGMNALAARLARRLNRLWRRRGRLFPERFHARALRTPREVRNALVYVLQNSRKHDAWRAMAPDPYSSGPAFDGWRRPVANLAESRSAFVGRPRTWLLSSGWRKQGLIDLRELPGGPTVVTRGRAPRTARARRPA
jgi:REP element-mobilizing transposase RayT